MQKITCIVLVLQCIISFRLLAGLPVNSGKSVEDGKIILGEKILTIVAFGNSITATRNTIDQVFAQRLPSLLLAEGIEAKVINSGLPGSHTGSIKDHNLFKIKHGMDRFETDVLTHNPDLVIIGFGTNDAHIDEDIPDGKSRIPLKEYQRNLKFMIKELQRRRIDVLLIAPNGLRGEYPEFQNVRLYQYVEVVKKLSKKYKTGLVDNFKFFSDYYETDESGEELLLDGVHPNDKGHALMAGEISQEIVKITRIKY
ncbi:SGNH/GDSL hydrolase family protein [Cyclobacterium marinum]|uniref:Lipolytic protein G-D-S-L family n=1 Tax=Cyclobacterium marinum (strain ATCC 25205 / DSM 745 / LMG 13164 / NCIMB 1802) TaxID=880070 RepID=G0IUV4_CYCMS|nr:GDSL-type esterase/lipase family protein [Cyclobacterium marinum]AEL26178.1 lipolytic protein G-D-S-L family [Cyclobacterium marinum DSM 745]